MLYEFRLLIVIPLGLKISHHDSIRAPSSTIGGQQACSNCYMANTRVKLSSRHLTKAFCSSDTSSLGRSQRGHGHKSRVNAIQLEISTSNVFSLFLRQSSVSLFIGTGSVRAVEHIPTNFYGSHKGGHSLGQHHSPVSDAYVTPHNAARQAVGAGIPNLTWDNVTLATYATKWAQHQTTLESCKLRHSRGPYGENIYWSSWASVPGDAVKAWVSEKPYYNYATNSCQSGKVCGHYTQIVWKNTKRVGCGSAPCSGGGTFVVCSYDPPGNYIGQKPY